MSNALTAGSACRFAFNKDNIPTFATVGKCPTPFSRQMRGSRAGENAGALAP